MTKGDLRWTGIWLWILILLLVTAAVAKKKGKGSGKKRNNECNSGEHAYYLSNYCGMTFDMDQRNLSEVVLKLTSTGNHANDWTCKMNVVTSPEERLSFKFLCMDLKDCNDGVTLYGESTNSSDALSTKICSTTSDVYITQDSKGIVQFTGDGLNNEGGFTILITSFYTAVNETCEHGFYKCRNNRCINPGLVCNSRDNCGDNSDENKSEDNEKDSKWWISFPCIIGGIIFFCICKKHKENQNAKQAKAKAEAKAKAKAKPKAKATTTAKPTQNNTSQASSIQFPSQSHQGSDGTKETNAAALLNPTLQDDSANGPHDSIPNDIVIQGSADEATQTSSSLVDLSSDLSTQMRSHSSVQSQSMPLSVSALPYGYMPVLPPVYSIQSSGLPPVYSAESSGMPLGTPPPYYTTMPVSTLLSTNTFLPQASYPVSTNLEQQDTADPLPLKESSFA